MITNLKDIPKNVSGIYKIEYDNGKIYIGQATNCYARALEHNSKNKYPCDQALKKHDAIFIILEQNINAQDLDKKEKEYIEFYDSTNREKGYNILEGGNASGKRGIENCNAAFNQSQLEQIINLLINNTEMSLIDIANKFGVTQSTILKISQGYSYKQENLTYPLRSNNHESIKKDSVNDYFANIQELIDLKNDLLYRWDLTVDTIAQNYHIPIKVIRDINNGRKFAEYGNFTYPIRAKNIRNNKQLTIKDVENILSLLRNTESSMEEIGKMYQLHRDTISKINQGKAYLIKDFSYPARQ